MEYITLNQNLFLANGGERSVYIHPRDSSKVVKVIFTQEKHNNQNKLDYVYAKYLTKKQVDFSHISKCYGWIKTNKGKGLVFERIENFDKTPIKTFAYYCKYKLLKKEQRLELIHDLKEYLFNNNILFVDASLSNVFCQKISLDKYKLVIFDGLGARRTGLKFWLYLHSTLFTKYKIQKQWNVFLKNYKIMEEAIVEPIKEL
jgi:hypothetical protein